MSVRMAPPPAMSDAPVSLLARLDARTQVSVPERRVVVVVALLATSASLISAAAVYIADDIAYSSQGDVFAHLLSARRVTDSLTPGFAQIGQYWPPLFHVMELPFAWIGPLYRSGLAGSIPAMVAYVVGVVGAYRLGANLTGDRRAGLLAAAAFGANPNLLFMQSLPMMESTIAATHVWTAASLAGFCREPGLRRATVAGAWTALACWSHYAAWVLPIYGAVIIGATAVRKGFSWRRAELYVISYVGLGVVAIALWLAWGFYLQGDPVFFLTTGVSNPAAEAAAALVEVEVPDRPDAAAFFAGRPGNLTFATINYGLALWHMLGPPAVLGSLAMIVVAVRRRVFAHPVGASAVTGAFVVCALWVFGGALGSPSFADLSGLDEYSRATNHNVRFGLYLVPLWAGAVALGAGTRFVRQAIAAGAVMATVAWFVVVPNPMGALEGQSIAYSDQDAIAAVLAARYDGGRVLMAQGGAGDRVIWMSGLDTSEFLTESNGDLFVDAIADPSVARWAVVAPDAAYLRPAVLAAHGFVEVFAVNRDVFRSSIWRQP